MGGTVVNKQHKLKHWCGFPGLFGLEAAPVLEFDFLIDILSLTPKDGVFPPAGELTLPRRHGIICVECVR